MNQTTLRETCLINGGVGLHSGQKTNLAFHPAPADHGIIFHRIDENVKIPANYRFAESSPLCTTLLKDGVKLTTVEHLLSVLSGMGVDNLLVEVAAEEIPIMDGSGWEFFEKFKQVGLMELDKPKRAIRITEPVSYEQGDIQILATPSASSEFTFAIDFDHQQLGQQEYHFTLTEPNYEEQIVRAKTFCMERDIPKMQEMGLVKGGSEKNAIILSDEGGFKNMEAMTWLNEPNLHKILDQIGDFYLADNLRILGSFYSHKSGHATHLAFVKHLLTETNSWEMVSL